MLQKKSLFFNSDPKNENQNKTPSEHFLLSFPQSFHVTSSYLLQVIIDSTWFHFKQDFHALFHPQVNSRFHPQVKSRPYSTPVTLHDAKCRRSNNNNHLMLVCQQVNHEAQKISGVFNLQLILFISLTAHYWRRQWKRSLWTVPTNQG